MFRTIGGISPCIEKPGFKRTVLRPVPNYRMKNAKMTYASAAGTYRTGWEVQDLTHVRLCVEVPFDAEAELQLPLAKADTILPWSGKELGEERRVILPAGSYELTYETDAPIVRIFTADDALMDIMSDDLAWAALLKAIPGIEQAGVIGAERSLRELMMQYGGDAANGILEQINRILMEAALQE